MKINFVSLGCDKNMVDSEGMLGIIKNKHQIIDDEAEADVFIINTCCFIEDALTESIDTILRLAEYKKTGNCKGIIVTGCIAERYREEVFSEMPEVDAIIGTGSFDKIDEALDAVTCDGIAGTRTYFSDINSLPDEQFYYNRVMQLSGSFFEYVKIAEGCDSFCTYCVIPKIRGKYRSRPLDGIINEANALAKKGVKEIILVAQDTSLYGKDKNNLQLPKLLQELSKIDGIEWIRIMYCYPEHITDELINEIAENPKVCKYLDVPIQHASDNVLKRMNRKSTSRELKEIFSKIKAKIHGICLRTTIITGFPGETNEDVEFLLDFISEIKFDRLGVFAYSREEGTPAYNYPNQIDDEEKNFRRERILERQKEISSSICQNFIGREIPVIIEGRLNDEDDVYCARSYRDAPEVDGLVFVNSKEEFMSGDFINVKITAAYDYDLIGEVRYELSK